MERSAALGRLAAALQAPTRSPIATGAGRIPAGTTPIDRQRKRTLCGNREGGKVLGIYMPRTNLAVTCDSRRWEGVGGADDKGRAVGRAGHELVHVGGGFVQRERHEKLLCVPHSVQGISGHIYAQKSPPPLMS